MKSIRNRLFAAALATLTVVAAPALAAEKYRIDPAHSFVQFSIQHLGFSLLQGRFNTVSGGFTYDADKPENSSINVEVATTSIDSNHAERDKHLRSKDFLDVEQFPKATFVSSKFSEKDGKGTLEGNLTLHGVTKAVSIPVSFIGAGKDPWGGYRRGYEGKLRIKRADYGISHNLGPAAEEMDLGFFIEGIRE
ncbi:MAG: YceI family protein [Magnetococcales bacterium]|nr:YceI family protein [Magnetococcales bacterium]NGZ28183.1 YceI family protein [Magnetococcales bacterium]